MITNCMVILKSPEESYPEPVLSLSNKAQNLLSQSVSLNTPNNFLLFSHSSVIHSFTLLLLLLFIFVPDIVRGETNCFSGTPQHISGSNTTVPCSPESFRGHFEDYKVEQQISCIESLRQEIHKLELKNEISKMEIGLLSRIKFYFSGVTNNDPEKDKQNKEIQSNKTCIEDYEKTLSHLERSLRKKGKEILEEINNEKKLANEDKDKIKGLKKEITKIGKTISFSGDDVFQTFDDYNQFFFNFMAGYESSTIKTMFEKGAPRAGFMVYIRHWEYEDLDSDYGLYWPFRNFHNAFTAQITSSAEQDIKIDTTKPPDTTGKKDALEFEMLFFSPMYRFKKLNWGKLWEYAGPIAIIGGKKTDDDRRINLRIYRGIRFAMSPEHYTDIMYGETAGLASSRLEVRGQLPVYRFDNGTRLYLGAIGNFGLTKETHKVTDKATGTEKDEVEADVIRVYLTWNVEFKDIFGNSSKK